VKRLGQRVRKLRLDARLTQETLAASAKLDAKHVQALESGVGNPTLATLLALAAGLGVPVADLFKS
jgi:transcriptional regulator with XRE-family HTH domain